MHIDKIKHMDDRIADGSWESTKRVRKKWSANPACLLDKNDKLRGAAERATVIAEYLATEQFGRDPNHCYSIPSVLNGYALAPGVNLDKVFTDSDLIKTLKQLHHGKSPQPNGVPNELWKVLLVNSELREVMRQFLNACFRQGRVPELWEIGEIIAIYMKRDPRNPENY